jgi:hypothetical protein
MVNVLRGTFHTSVRKSCMAVLLMVARGATQDAIYFNGKVVTVDA